MSKFLIASTIKAGDHIDQARAIGESAFSRLVGHNRDGFLADQLMQDGYNRTGDGDPTHYICFGKYSQYQIDVWNKALEELGIRDIDPDYSLIKIDSKEAFLRRTNFKYIGKVSDDE